MISFRRFKNTDPPALADVWNESHPARSAYPIRTPAVLERWIFSKPYFDADGLIVAVDDADNGKVVGYVLAGFGPNEELTALDYSQGVICSLGIRPSVQRHRRGPRSRPQGGGIPDHSRRHDSPSRAALALLSVRLRHLRRHQRAGLPRLRRRRRPVLQVARLRTRRHHLRLPQEARCAVGGLRYPLRALGERYETQVLRAAGVPSWWHDCVWGTLEPVEFRLLDKLSNNFLAARAVVWELEGYGWRWGFPSAGVIDIQVRQDLRKMGLAKLLMSQILRFLQDQFFGICELHAADDQPALVSLCRSVGMEQVDVGTTYIKRGTGTEAGNVLGRRTLLASRIRNPMNERRSRARRQMTSSRLITTPRKCRFKRIPLSNGHAARQNPHFSEVNHAQGHSHAPPERVRRHPRGLRNLRGLHHHRPRQGRRARRSGCGAPSTRPSGSPAPATT